MYLLRLGMRPWRQSPLSQVFTSVMMGALIFIGAILIWMQGALSPVIFRLKQEKVITAYVAPSVTEREESVIVDKIKTRIGAQRVKPSQVKLVRSSEFVSQISKEHPKLAKELVQLGNEMSHVVPRFVTVAGYFPSKFEEEIQKIDGIATAESSEHRYHHIVSAFLSVQWGARLLLLGVISALLTGLVHLVRLNFVSLAGSLSILRHWGAGPLKLRCPLVLSSWIVGTLGGLFASVGWWAFSQRLGSKVKTLTPILEEIASPAFHHVLTLLVAGSMIGLLTGLVTAMFAQLPVRETR